MAMKSSILKIIKANNQDHKPEIIEQELIPETTKSKQKKAIDSAKVITKVSKKKSPEQIEVPAIGSIEQTQLQGVTQVPNQNNQSKKILPPIPDRTPQEQQAIRNTYQSKKILPLIPDRTPEEQQAIRDAYQEEVKPRFLISLVNKLLDLADINQAVAGELVVKRIEASVGKVADNVNEDSTRYLSVAVIESTIRSTHEFLLSNPLIVAPTWDTLIDNNLSVRAKARKLNEIGWDFEIIRRKGQKSDSVFPRIYLLARILERGIV